MSIICATCLRCGHEGAISPETLRRYGQSANVTLAYLSASQSVRCAGARR